MTGGSELGLAVANLFASNLSAGWTTARVSGDDWFYGADDFEASAETSALQCKPALPVRTHPARCSGCRSLLDADGAARRHPQHSPYMKGCCSITNG